MDAQPSYSWRNKQATVLKGRVAGENFLPLPGGYQPSANSRPRGGQPPRVTDVAMPGGVIDLTERVGGSFADPASQNFFPDLPGGKAAEGQGLRKVNRARVGNDRFGRDIDSIARKFGVGF
jgi:hypothetical protein